jgi:AcrR family transcriptional regulator
MCAANNKAARMSAQQRREQIVEVAAELFSRKGFTSTTTKEIAERAGVSEAIIFRHFTTKDELYSAILDHKVRQCAERAMASLEWAARRKDDRAFFSTLAFEILEFHGNDPTIMRLLMFSALEGHNLSEIFFNSTARRPREMVRRYIKRRMADGAFRAIDPDVCARAFVGMVIYHVQLSHIFKLEGRGRLSNRQIADRLADIFLNGVSKPAPRNRDE